MQRYNHYFETKQAETIMRLYNKSSNPLRLFTRLSIPNNNLQGVLMFNTTTEHKKHAYQELCKILGN